MSATGRVALRRTRDAEIIVSARVADVLPVAPPRADSMTGTTKNLWLSALIVAGSTTAAIAAANAVLPNAPPALRLGCLAGAAATAAIAVAALFRHQQQCEREAEQFLEELARLAPNDVHNDAHDQPVLPDGHPLCGSATRLRDVLTEQYGRLEHFEHARTAAELRCRRALAEAEQVRNIFASLGEPILAIDQYHEIVLANGSARELFDIGAQDTAKRALAQVVRCQKLVELLTGAAQRKSASVRSEELEIADVDGQTHWYRATAARLAHAGGEGPESPSAGAVAVLRGIDDRKALQKRNAEFVSAVSHEMKTPLAGIKAYVELLVDGDAEDEATREEFLQIVNGQADRLQRLIENLLNLARIEAGVVQVHKTPRSLNDVLEEALRVVRPSAEAKHIELISDLSPLYLGVLADRDMLLQAAINLLSNAIKYTPDEGRVTLRSRMADSEVRFEVQDTGIGLSEDDCQRVFEKFYRVKKSRDMATGTGLGLPLAKHIVEDVHGGRITVESKLGEGSTFAVTLPAAAQRIAGD